MVYAKPGTPSFNNPKGLERHSNQKLRSAIWGLFVSKERSEKLKKSFKSSVKSTTELLRYSLLLERASLMAKMVQVVTKVSKTKDAHFTGTPHILRASQVSSKSQPCSFLAISDRYLQTQNFLSCIHSQTHILNICTNHSGVGTVEDPTISCNFQTSRNPHRPAFHSAMPTSPCCNKRHLQKPGQ